VKKKKKKSTFPINPFSDRITLSKQTYLPVAPKTFPLGNSHIPAMNCVNPPAKMAMPMMTLGCSIPRVLTLNMDSMNVVAAKENRPLVDRDVEMDRSVSIAETRREHSRRARVGYPGRVPLVCYGIAWTRTILGLSNAILFDIGVTWRRHGCSYKKGSSPTREIGLTWMDFYT